METLNLLNESRIAGAIRISDSEKNGMISHLRYCLRNNGFEFFKRNDTKNEDFLKRTGMDKMSEEDFSKFLQMGCSPRTYKATVKNTLPNKESEYIHFFHLYKNISDYSRPEQIYVKLYISNDNRVVIISFHKLDDEIYPDYGDGSFEDNFASKWVDLFNNNKQNKPINPIISYKVQGSELTRYRIIFTFKNPFPIRTVPENIKNALGASFPKGMHYLYRETSIALGNKPNEAIALLAPKPKTAATNRI